MDKLRIGHGFDVHQLVAGRKLIIGGVHIPYDKGLLGHSDGDALFHAVADALLGAANLGDIGQHFPSTDDRYADADSGHLLRQVAHLIRDAGFTRILNIDVVVMAERPLMGPHIPSMKRNVFRILEIDQSRVSIKATTTEKLGFLGRGEGVAVSAVCLVSGDE